jgi:hypothetical protein
MTEDPNWEFSKFFDDLRKSASIKTGAIMFGEAQVAYYDVLKRNMSEEEAYNMLAHTTEAMIRGVAMAAGPVASALLSATALFEALGIKQQTTDKEVPGGS